MPGHDQRRADAPEPPVLSESRSRVLTALQASETALGVDELARRLELHPNTARFHLDALVEAGLALRSIEQRDTPGRPRTLYTNAPGSARAGRRSYQLLAEILTSYIAGRVEEPAQAANEAGEAWGRYLAGPVAPFEKVGAEAATRRLVELLDDIGFAPEVVDTDQDRQVLLHHCPFRELAEEHRAVVCSVHSGLIRGVLEQLHAPLDAGRLEPFVTPSLCVAHVVRHDEPTGRPTTG